MKFVFRQTLAVIITGLSANQGLSGESSWRPADNVPNRIYVSDKRFVAAYQYRVLFGEIGPDITAGRDAETGMSLLRAGQKIDPLTLPNSKTWTFSNPFTIFQSASGSRFLLCTHPHLTKYRVRKEEYKQLRRRRVDWRDPSAKYPDFCGIVGSEGLEIFKFPFAQKAPKDLLYPIAISGDGAYGAVAIGETVPGEDGSSVGKWREIWTWDFPKRLEKHPGPWKSGTPADQFGAMEEVRFKYRNKQKGK